eukprot:13415534-Ditylum_brightwellii.AAC.1
MESFKFVSKSVNQECPITKQVVLLSIFPLLPPLSSSTFFSYPPPVARKGYTSWMNVFSFSSDSK